MQKNYFLDTEWFMFLSESTDVQCSELKFLLTNYEPDQELFIGNFITGHGDIQVQKSHILNKELLVSTVES